MGYTDILREYNWTNLPTDSLSPSGSIYTIGFTIVTSSAALTTLDYFSDEDYYDGVTGVSNNFSTSIPSSITSTALPMTFPL